MDPKDDLSDPVTLITDPQKSLINRDNPDLTAGMTFFGQFLDHDMTFDPTSSLEEQQDPEAIHNFRTPVLELDNLYGAGPGASPHLYDQTVDGGLTTFLIEEIPGSAGQSRDGARRFDMPRNSQNTALIGDPRNDENLIVSQLHLAMLRFHNAVVAHVKAHLGLTNPNEIFAEAQRLVRWHYQWIIVHEFLEKTVGNSVVNDVLENGRKFYEWRNAPFIPVEFSVAAYPLSDILKCGQAIAQTSAQTTRANSSPSSSTTAYQTRPIPTICAGQASSATLHRLADVLRLWRQQGPEQQENRHQAFIGVVRPARDPELRTPVACSTQPVAPSNLRRALRAAHLQGHGDRSLAPGRSR
jgi:hypothetical protein